MSKRVEFEMPSVICHCVVHFCAECGTDKLFRQNPALVEHAVISVTTSMIFKGVYHDTTVAPTFGSFLDLYIPTSSSKEHEKPRGGCLLFCGVRCSLG